MATLKEYINALNRDKQNLVNNLLEKGVFANTSETFTQLVPKILDINSNVESSNLNVKYSINEPSDNSKNIWIKTENVNKSYITNEISIDNNLIISSFNIDKAIFMGQSNIVYNDKIYLAPYMTNSGGPVSAIAELDVINSVKNNILIDNAPVFSGIALINDDIYLIGGMFVSEEGTPTKTILKYNITSKIIKEISITNMIGLIYCTTAVINNNIYISGLALENGQYINKFGVIDTENYSFNEITIPDTVPTLVLSSFCVYDNKIYIIGGANIAGSDNEINYDILEYNPSSGIFTVVYKNILPNDSEVVPMAFASNLYNNKIIILLGGMGSHINNKIYEFNPTDNTLNIIGEFNNAQQYQQTALIDNNIYVLSGNDAFIYKISLPDLATTNIIKTLSTPFYSKQYNQIGDNVFAFSGLYNNITEITKIIKYNFINNELVELSTVIPNNYYPKTSCVIDNNIYSIDGEYADEGINTQTQSFVLRKFDTQNYSFSIIDITLPQESSDIIRCCSYENNKIIYVVCYKENLYPTSKYTFKPYIINLNEKTIENLDIFSVDVSLLSYMAPKMFFLNNCIILIFSDYIIKYNIITKEINKYDINNPAVFNYAENCAIQQVGCFLYLFGGRSRSESSNLIRIFNLITNEYSTYNLQLPQKLGYCATANKNNEIYLIGGLKSYSGGESNEIIKYSAIQRINNFFDNDVLITSSNNNENSVSIVASQSFLVNININSAYKQSTNIVNILTVYIKKNNNWEKIN